MVPYKLRVPRMESSRSSVGTFTFLIWNVYVPRVESSRSSVETFTFLVWNVRVPNIGTLEMLI